MKKEPGASRAPCITTLVLTNTVHFQGLAQKKLHYLSSSGRFFVYKICKKIHCDLENPLIFVYVFAAVQLWSVECECLAKIVFV